MSSFDEKEKRIDSQVEQVDSLIASVSMEIRRVEAKIDAIEEKIETIDARLALIEKDIKFPPADVNLGAEMARLREEKTQLRTKEAQLRTKEAQLRDEEALHLQEKAQLREEKAQLRNVELLHRQVGALTVGRGAGGGKTASALLISTPVAQGSASSFAKAGMKKAVCGFGHLPSSCRVDPTGDQRVSRRLIPTPHEVDAETLVLACMGERATLAARGEDETFGVRSVLNEIVRSLPHLESSGSSMSKCGSLGAGISTNTSVPDFAWLVNGKVLGILEAKDGAASTIVALRQAAVTAMAIVSDLRSLNLPAEHIVVPVAGCTGSMIQFGAVICLDDSFGTFLATSAILDLSDMAQNLLAAAYLHKACACVGETDRLLDALEIPQGAGTPRSPVLAMSLDMSKYWIKYLSDDVFSRGLGLFTSSSANRLDLGPGLEHMGRALTLLYRHPAAREFVVFPLSVRSPNQLELLVPEVETSNCYMIIYEDLSKLGYRMGTPNRLEDEALYQSFLLALQGAVREVHSARVLHCDLYPSNFMWRCDDVSESGAGTSTKISIKIIDWDCAHCLAEGAFHPRIAEALAMHTPTRPAIFGAQHDLDYIAVLAAQQDSGDGLDEVWQALASNDKSNVDRAFYHLFAASISRKGGPFG